jgi:hypothetical protein
MNNKERLREYIENDPMYVEYKNGVNNDVSDFDRFCINHCEDIEDLLDEVEELHNKIDKAIDFINSQSPDAGVSGHRIKEILKDSDVDENK